LRPRIEGEEVRAVTISVAPSIFSKVWTRLTLPWPALAERFSTPSVGPKECAARWCAGRFGGDGSRKLANFIDAELIVLDFDGNAPPDRVAAAYAADLGIVVTTASYDREDDQRCRLIRVTDRTFTLSEHDRLWRAEAAKAEAVGLTPDYSGRDGTHAWVEARIKSASSDFESYELHGSPVSVDAALALIPEDKPEERANLMPAREADVRTVDRAERYLATLDPAVSGQGGHAQMFRAATTLVRGFELDEVTAFALLAEYNQRAQPPFLASELRHKIRSAATRSKLPPGYLRDKPRATR
jgi:hypothetical protein